MFDTEASDFDIVDATPLKRDLMQIGFDYDAECDKGLGKALREKKK